MEGWTSIFPYLAVSCDVIHAVRFLVKRAWRCGGEASGLDQGFSEVTDCCRGSECLPPIY